MGDFQLNLATYKLNCGRPDIELAHTSDYYCKVYTLGMTPNFGAVPLDSFACPETRKYLGTGLEFPALANVNIANYLRSNRHVGPPGTRSTARNIMICNCIGRWLID
jgi:hypothetical protein